MGSVWIFNSYKFAIFVTTGKKKLCWKEVFANMQSMLPLTSFDIRNITTLRTEACSVDEFNMARTMDMVFKSAYLIKILILFSKEEFL